MVAAGDGHTVALSEAGHVFTWGYGEFGQLGHGDEEDQWAPRQVEAGRFGGERVVFVAAGGNHTVAVTAGGRLYTWGLGYLGQLGHGDTGDRLVPTLVRAEAFGGSAVVRAACGIVHTLVVTEAGALWACGNGQYGRLGLNDEEDRHVFERVGMEAFGGARVVAAAAGNNHSAAVTKDGALWTWGRGDDGRLGHGNKQRRLAPMRVPEVTLKLDFSQRGSAVKLFCKMCMVQPQNPEQSSSI
jgi:alpha-tubulin suppressor-like RCC1 family protein